VRLIDLRPRLRLSSGGGGCSEEGKQSIEKHRLQSRRLPRRFNLPSRG
jgi:hypothetical protein